MWCPKRLERKEIQEMQWTVSKKIWKKRNKGNVVSKKIWKKEKRKCSIPCAKIFGRKKEMLLAMSKNIWTKLNKGNVEDHVQKRFQYAKREIQKKDS